MTGPAGRLAAAAPSAFPSLAPLVDSAALDYYSDRMQMMQLPKAPRGRERGGRAGGGGTDEDVEETSAN